MLALDHHSQRVLGPDRKAKHKTHWTDYLEEIEDKNERLAQKNIETPVQNSLTPSEHD